VPILGIVWLIIRHRQDVARKRVIYNSEKYKNINPTSVPVNKFVQIINDKSTKLLLKEPRMHSYEYGDVKLIDGVRYKIIDCRWSCDANSRIYDVLPILI